MTIEAEVRPFRIEVPQEVLDDLYERLSRTKWPDDIPVETQDPAHQGILPSGWHYGLPAAHLRPLVQRWTSGYDWRTWKHD
jgi:epoxide hydrolase